MPPLTVDSDAHEPSVRPASPLGGARLRRVIGVVVLVFGLAASAISCGTDASQEGRMSQSNSTATTDPAMIEEALRFGGIVLPPAAEVLGVQHDKGIDQRYRLAIRADPASVETLLSGSGFTTALAPDPGPFMAPVEGFDLPANAVSSTSDTLAPAPGRTNTVFRRVAVDRSDPATCVVHLWLFTT